MSECVYIDDCRILKSFRTESVREYWRETQCQDAGPECACRKLYESGNWPLIELLTRDQEPETAPAVAGEGLAA
jgi:hypothetical protein